MTWHTVDATGEWQPEWTDAPGQFGMQSYGGPDAVVDIQDDKLHCRVSRGATRFLLFFWPPFMIVAVSLICWLESDSKYFGAILAAAIFCGILTFALIYGLLWYHENAGPYIVVDLQAGQVSLPRHRTTLDLAGVNSFQWIEGRSRTDAETKTDLNILVDRSGQLFRYHIMGSPRREVATQIAEFCGVPIYSIKCRTGVYRDSDRQPA